jgi:hypothetical protein
LTGGSDQSRPPGITGSRKPLAGLILRSFFLALGAPVKQRPEFGQLGKQFLHRIQRMTPKAAQAVVSTQTPAHEKNPE